MPCANKLWSQEDCSLTLSGYITDLGTGEPLEFVNIYVEETGQGTISDSLGYYQISGLCAGHLHLSMSHIGCQSQEYHIDIDSDATANYFLNHTDHVIHDVQITAAQLPIATQFYESVGDLTITDQSYSSLTDLASLVPGVSSINNGGGISKPVVHGLYGNRLAIFNNGVAQSGQQWGTDHSPEIDPLTANVIKVIKGVSAIEYPDGNLGSVILVEPDKIKADPHLHGRVNYFFRSNGLGQGLNLQLQQTLPTFAYRATVTGKYSGDLHTPDYFLNNTGGRELNASLLIDKEITERWFAELYLSSFNARLGVLRGSHIGNLTDLESAFNLEVPFFTDETFSYDLEAPVQDVNHHLVKAKTNYFFRENRWVEFTLAAQYNLRDEFDIRRGNRSDTPSFSINQSTYSLNAKYIQETDNGVTLKTGIQAQSIDNENNSDTGILPLIPNYFQYKGGVFSTLSKSNKKGIIELGLRYDLVHQRVAYLTSSFPRENLRDNNTFHTFGSSLGGSYSFGHSLSASLNTGVSNRNPAINELYSQGLHQGVSGIEIGDRGLAPELSWKSTLSLSGDLEEAFYWEVLGYYQLINDYIYLAPQDILRLTIRGAFPVFAYTQTDARIVGLDTYVKYEFSPSLETSLGYSLIHGWDITEDIPLLFIPANRINGNLKYEIPFAMPVKGIPLENLTVELDHSYTFEQQNYDEGQDFLAPPEGYHLTDFKVAGDLQFRTVRLRLNLKVTNLFDVAYRDLLNRQRYFADDVGRSINLGVNLRF